MKPVAAAADGMTGFLLAVEQGMESDSCPAGCQKVRLMTMHSAKGLEFPVVFVAGCEDGLVPLRPRFEKRDRPERSERPHRSTRPEKALEVHQVQDDEEARLFFVAMSRAEDELILTRSQRRRIWGTESELPPSPYISRIPEDLLNRLSVSEMLEKRRKKKKLQLRLF